MSSEDGEPVPISGMLQGVALDEHSAMATTAAYEAILVELGLTDRREQDHHNLPDGRV
jgi:hypothetical protein